jgi:hypothetical protein
MADDAIRPEHRLKMNEIAKWLDAAINESGVKCGFALLVFDFGADGFMNYISNANRDDMIRAMEEFIARHVNRN